jgi:hypothetical protein
MAPQTQGQVIRNPIFLAARAEEFSQAKAGKMLFVDGYNLILWRRTPTHPPGKI